MSGKKKTPDPSDLITIPFGDLVLLFGYSTRSAFTATGDRKYGFSHRVRLQGATRHSLRQASEEGQGGLNVRG